MPHKRRPTVYQNQVRFISLMFVVVLILAFVGVIILLNRPPGGYHF
jgi:cbb3-type cytochrome oxidase subunit 3